MKTNMTMDNFSSLTKEQKDAIVDEDVEAFSKFMASLKDVRDTGPLHPLEKAIVKTYIIWKLKAGSDGAQG